MTQKVLAKPVYWLKLEDCERLFKAFQKKLEFNEPIPPFETRYEGRLEAILESARQTFGKKLLYPTILDVSSVYFNHIVRGHPFQNGNKRMGLLFTHVFLLIHAIDFTLNYEEMLSFALIIALSGINKISSEETKELCKDIIYKYTKGFAV